MPPKILISKTRIFQGFVNCQERMKCSWGSQGDYFQELNMANRIFGGHSTVIDHSYPLEFLE
jgi:hypothetical protein